MKRPKDTDTSDAKVKVKQFVFSLAAHILNPPSKYMIYSIEIIQQLVSTKPAT